MLKFSSSFECGNGKNFRQISENRYRCEVVGDKKVYCYYFCFEIENTGKDTASTIEVWHDPVVNDPEGFISHFPTTIWVSTDDGKRFHALEQSRCHTLDDHIEISLFLKQGKKLLITNHWPCTYSDTCNFLKNLVKDRKNCEIFSLGISAGNREILGIKAGNASGPRILCLAGQHPVEFSGIWAVRAIVDFITSCLPEAEALRNKFIFEIIPVVNPDGNVAGRNCFTDEGIDLYQVFGDYPDREHPDSTEGKLLWQWATEQNTDLWLNFHCYLGWRTNSEFPYDGWYEVPYNVFKNDSKRKIYRALCDTMRLLTDAPSTSTEPETHWLNSFEYQLAKRFSIPHVFYEINGATAGPFQSAKRGLKVFRNAMKTLEHVIENG
ncbi:MAG: M14 family zinc carboxypeptidase [Candidatus Ratteibacteria bacterium]